MSILYFNETGPIYREEHVQAKEFFKFAHTHVVVVANQTASDANGSLDKETVWFNWEAFHPAVTSFQASDLSAEHEFTTVIPPRPHTQPTTTGGNALDAISITTLQSVLDALVDHFTSAFTDVLFIDNEENPNSLFFDTLRRNLYHAFTRYLDSASDTPERYLSFHGRSHLGKNGDGANAGWSGWEYRLLFSHVQSGIVKGLVMTVTLEGSFGNGAGEEAWYGVSLDSSGQFSGVLKAMQVIVGEGFRCP